MGIRWAFWSQVASRFRLTYYVFRLNIAFFGVRWPPGRNAHPTPKPPRQKVSDLVSDKCRIPWATDPRQKMSFLSSWQFRLELAGIGWSWSANSPRESRYAKCSEILPLATPKRCAPFSTVSRRYAPVGARYAPGEILSDFAILRSDSKRFCGLLRTSADLGEIPSLSFTILHYPSDPPLTSAGMDA
jgi:hypothetical protein